ncbi:MAG: hypothetical protein ACR2N3_14900 [Pyrinomonadaceae bacterium]
MNKTGLRLISFQVVFSCFISVSVGCNPDTKTANTNNPVDKISTVAINNSTIINDKTSQSGIQKDIPEQEIWNGQGGKFQLRWTNKDLYVKSSEGINKIFSTYANKWLSIVKSNDSDGIYEIEFSILSVIGNLITIEISQTITGKYAANINQRVTWVTLDLSKPGNIAQSYSEDERGSHRNAALTDYFPSKNILEALLANSKVKQELIRKNLAPPKSLKGLLQIKNFSLDDDPTQLNNFLSEYALNKFVFGRLEGENVKIFLELLDSYSPRLGEVPRIELSLPIPLNLKSALSRAESRQEGFLFKDSATVSQGKKTYFHFKN